MSKPSFSIPTGYLLTGLGVALLLGGLLGFIRYWLGFFVIAQGVCLGLLVPYLTRKLGGRAKPGHPGMGRALLMASLWFLACALGLMIGFGLAQPWFEPAAWAGRVLQGGTAEFVFGVASNAAYSRAMAMGAQGGFWLLLNCLDWGLMFFFLWIMPWSHKGGARRTTEAASC